MTKWRSLEYTTWAYSDLLMGHQALLLRDRCLCLKHVTTQFPIGSHMSTHTHNTCWLFPFLAALPRLFEPLHCDWCNINFQLLWGLYPQIQLFQTGRPTKSHNLWKESGHRHDLTDVQVQYQVSRPVKILKLKIIKKDLNTRQKWPKT